MGLLVTPPRCATRGRMRPQTGLHAGGVGSSAVGTHPSRPAPPAHCEVAVHQRGAATFPSWYSTVALWSTNGRIEAVLLELYMHW